MRRRGLRFAVGQAAALLAAAAVWFVGATLVHLGCGGGLGLFGEDPNSRLDTGCRNLWLVPLLAACLGIAATPAVVARRRRRNRAPRP